MILRAVAMLALVVSAGGSLGLMLIVGHNNRSRLLMLLFGLWVLSPFAMLVFANVLAKRWSSSIQMTLYTGMLMVAFASLAIYGNVAFGPRRAQPAFWFLIAPLLSWLLIAILIGFAEIRRRRS